MKHFMMLMLTLLTQLGNSQINGNGILETKILALPEIHTLNIEIYGDITVDASPNQNASIKMTTDSNLLKLIEISTDNGILTIDQKQWIEASSPIKIALFLPNLKNIIHDNHETVTVTHLNQDQLNVNANLGTMVLKGQVHRLDVAITAANLIANDLKVETVRVEVGNRAKAVLSSPDKLSGLVKKFGVLSYVNEPKINGIINEGGRIGTTKDLEKVVNPEALYIDFKLKNNSINRARLYVLGPKPDGNTFSYGFAMMPLSTRKERWTVGTEIFKVNELGLKTLLVRISKSDQNKTVNLFAND